MLKTECKTYSVCIYLVIEVFKKSSSSDPVILAFYEHLLLFTFQHIPSGVTTETQLSLIRTALQVHHMQLHRLFLFLLSLLFIVFLAP